MNTTTKLTDKERGKPKSSAEREPTGKALPDDMVAEIAYADWEKAGKPPDQYEEFWDEAVEELKRGLLTGNGQPPAGFAHDKT